MPTTQCIIKINHCLIIKTVDRKMELLWKSYVKKTLLSSKIYILNKLNSIRYIKVKCNNYMYHFASFLFKNDIYRYLNIKLKVTYFESVNLILYVQTISRLLRKIAAKH